jgi:hypothetical protein
MKCRLILFRYSFNQGSVHIVMIATELHVAPGTAQYRWIENDLKSVDRTVTPWIIFTGHRPMYTAAAYNEHFGIFSLLRSSKTHWMN